MANVKPACGQAEVRKKSKIVDRKTIKSFYDRHFRSRNKFQATVLYRNLLQ